MSVPDWEIYTNTVPVDRQIPKTLYDQLPRGKPLDYDDFPDERGQHGLFNPHNFPTPIPSFVPGLSYTSKCYDYARK